MSDYLPFDVLTNILLRLPVAAILRCRSVCKPWRALVDSPVFIKLQVDYSAATTKNAILFIREVDLFELEHGDLHSAPYIDGLRREASLSIAISPSVPRECMNLFGSCNGLLCFSDGDEKFIITNPATRKSFVPSHCVSHCSFGLGFDSLSSTGVYLTGCGFGYDSVSGDYKVVAVYRIVHRTVGLSELISYGVGSNSTLTVDFPYSIPFPNRVGSSIGGAIHWIARGHDNVAVIVGFDLGLNQCREVPQPEYPNGKSSDMRLRELGKCLCIFANYKERFVDVWMMKEYGVKDSWSIMFSIPYPGLCYKYEIRPLGFSMTGHEILLELDCTRLVWYDLRNQTGHEILLELDYHSTKEVTIHGLGQGFINAIVCYGSLVSPDCKFLPGGSRQETSATKSRKEEEVGWDDVSPTEF
ncbi:unnamed protein product [Linum tenue]|uniref:F-box domain-containing protein n=1 Tax=Linum tenue TaxID=586396 RepID=A0AAV0L3C3_9ROSI|nr:unnamed protein product [Linum tenue]